MTSPVGRRFQRHIFVDTSAFFAAASQRDADFENARRILIRLERERMTLVTTTYVVAEAHALFLARRGRDAGVRFLRNFTDSAVELVRPSSTHEQLAREIIYRYIDKTFSLTDAISFVVMESMGVSTAFTFDADFRQYGFAVMEP